MLLLLLACTGEAPVDRANLLLVTIDTTRYDHVDRSIDGATPNLALLASGGSWYTNARTQTPITLPAHTSLMTGLPPLEHGVLDNAQRLDPQLLTLAERLSAEGWSTAATIASLPLTSQFGLDQGFQQFDETGLAFLEAGHLPERAGPDVTAAAKAQLATLEEPWFLWVHYFDPHRPWTAPGKPGSYEAEIGLADAQLGELLQDLPDNTVVAVTSDHGEGLGEHGERTHGLFLHEATLRVPMVVRTPGQQPEVVDDPVNLAWLGRELLNELGVAHDIAPEQPELYATEMPRNALGLSPAYALDEGDLRLVRTSRDRLFDLAEDPDEVEDLALRRPEQTLRLATSMSAAQARAASGEPEALDDQLAAQLAALGYVRLEGARGGGDVYENLHLVRGAESGRFYSDEQPADPDYLASTLQDSHIPALWTEALANGDLGAHRPELLRLAAQRFPESASVLTYVASMHLEDQHPELAAAAFDDARGALGRRQLPSPNTLVLLARVALDLERPQAASEVLDLTPETLYGAAVLLDRARVVHRLGLLDRAMVDYDAGLRLRPEDASGWRDLAGAQAMAGSLVQAEQSLRRSLELDPGDRDSWLRLAALQSAQGQEPSACGRYEALDGPAPCPPR